MKIQAESFINVARKLRVITEHMNAICLNKYSIPLAVEELQRVIEDIYSIKVAKKAVVLSDSITSNVPGSMGRFAPAAEGEKPTAIILVDNILPQFDQRFVAGKELCHIAIDSQDDWSTNPHATITALTKTYEIDGQQNGNHVVEDRIVASEILAEVAAREIFLPSTQRREDVRKLEAKEISIEFLEAHYKLPRHQIRLALSAQSLTVSDLMLPYLLGEKL